jgi:hypothetical protein
VRGVASLCVAAGCLLALTGCTADVAIVEAQASVNGDRIRLLLDSCNADLDIRVAESPSQVRVTVRRPDVLRFGGDDCQDIAILTLDAPLASRELVDATGMIVPVSTAVPGQGGEPDWPWDRDRFTVDDYNAALQAMVQCLEAEDPDMTAWVTEDLNWDTYAWDKAPVNGNVAAPAIETCRTRHLDLLT